MTTERLLSQVEQTQLTRRDLLKGIGVVGVATFIGGDTAPKPLESPVDEYEIVAAFGDSYTLGVGASCSENTYPRRLAQFLNAKECEVVARSGCTPKELVYGIGGLPSQIDRLPANANLLVGTIGGNATDLRKLGGDCIKVGCGPGTITFEQASAIFRSNDYYDDLKRAYDALLSKAVNADIIVNGYPKFVVSYRAPDRIERLFRRSGIPELTALGQANDEGLANIVEMNNAAAQSIISGIGDHRLVYAEPPKHIDIVSTRLQGKPDYFHLEDSLYAGHPNDLGYNAIMQASLVAITAMYNRNKRKSGFLASGRGMGR